MVSGEVTFDLHAVRVGPYTYVGRGADTHRCGSEAAPAAARAGRHRRIFFPDGERYDGTTRDDVPHGAGVCHYVNGDKYEGQVCAEADRARRRLWAQGLGN